jgi:hypothetical protein
VRAIDSCGNVDVSPASADLTVNNCGTGCSCSGSAAVETACNDGIDNDSDTLTDCADPDCNGMLCGSAAGTLRVVEDCTEGSSPTCSENRVMSFNAGATSGEARFTIAAPPVSDGVTYDGTLTLYVEYDDGNDSTGVLYETTVLGVCAEPASDVAACTIDVGSVLNSVAGGGTFDIGTSLVNDVSGNEVYIRAKDYAGTTYDPKLDYTYTSVCTDSVCPLL